MKYNTISLKEIIGRIKRHPLIESLPEETIVDYSVDFLRIMGLCETFDDKVVTLQLKNYMAALPEDFYEITQVRTIPSFNYREPIYFRSTTDTFYKSPNKYDKVPYTYKLQGSVIICSPMREGNIEVAYKAIQLDDCGLPVVPDNAKFIRALEAYIKVQKFTELFELGQIQLPVLQNAQQEYCFAAGAVHTDMKMPSLDEMESIGNLLNSPISRRFGHHKAFADDGSKMLNVIH